MDIWQFDFMQRALAAGLLAAVVCPVIGLFIVVRHQSFIGDGLGHIAFAGVAAGWVGGFYPLTAAAVLTVLAALGIERLRRWRRDNADLVLALFFYTGMAVAIIFVTMMKTASMNVMSLLFGSILTVTPQDVTAVSLLSVLVLLVVAAFFSQLQLVCFNDDVARAAGVKVDLVNGVFSVATALTVVTAMRVVGILLVSALMIVPVACALVLRRGFRQTLAWAVLFALAAVLGGLTCAYYLDIAPGGTIVLSAVLLFLVTLAGRGAWTAFRRGCAGG